MTHEKLRILPSDEVLQNSAPSARDDAAQQVEDIIAKTFEISQFETKEEYLKFLIEEKEIAKDQNPPAQGEEELIRLRGHLPIDNRVKSGLDWSEVVADSATVIDGKISRYANLPKARKWLKTNLQAADAKEFLEHNLYGRFTDKNNRLEVAPGVTLKIADAEKMPDLSKVTVDKFYLYSKSKVPLSKLPYTRHGAFNINRDNLLVDCSNPYKTAKDKKLGRELVRSMAPNLLQRWWQNVRPSGKKDSL